MGFLKERIRRSSVILDVQSSQFTCWAVLRVGIAMEAPSIQEMFNGDEFVLPISRGTFFSILVSFPVAGIFFFFKKAS